MVVMKDKVKWSEDGNVKSCGCSKAGEALQVVCAETLRAFEGSSMRVLALSSTYPSVGGIAQLGEVLISQWAARKNEDADFPRISCASLYYCVFVGM